MAESDFIHLLLFSKPIIKCGFVCIRFENVVSWLHLNNNCKLNSNKLTDERKVLEGPGEKEVAAQTYKLAPDWESFNDDIGGIKVLFRAWFIRY